jgi:hypothetical protein
VGKDLIVVPDDALIQGEPSAHEGEHKKATERTDAADSHPWEERALEESTRPSIWTRRTDTSSRARSETPAEPGLKTETARPVENYQPAGEARPETSQPDREDEAVITAPKDQSQA